MLKKLSLSLPLIACSTIFATNSTTISLRTGIDLSALSLQVGDDRPIVSLSTYFPLGSASLDLRQQITADISFTLSSTYLGSYQDSGSTHALSSGFYTNYHLSKQSFIGIGADIQHYLLGYQPRNFLGNIHSIRGGVNITNYVDDSLYTRFEISQSMTPTGYKTREKYSAKTTEEDIFYSLASIHSYTISFAVGLDLDI